MNMMSGWAEALVPVVVIRRDDGAHGKYGTDQADIIQVIGSRSHTQQPYEGNLEGRFDNSQLRPASVHPYQ